MLEAVPDVPRRVLRIVSGQGLDVGFNRRVVDAFVVTPAGSSVA
jgi:hypothetical protein